MSHQWLAHQVPISTWWMGQVSISTWWGQSLMAAWQKDYFRAFEISETKIEPSANFRDQTYILAYIIQIKFIIGEALQFIRTIFFFFFDG